MVDSLDADLLPQPIGTNGITLTDFNTPGTDLRFDGGHSVEANVKIGTSRSTLTQHLDKYPDVDVVYGSSEIANHAQGLGVCVIEPGANTFQVDGDPVVVDIGRRAADFDHNIATSLAGVDASATSLPIISTLMVAWRGVRRLRGLQPGGVVVAGMARDAGVATSAHVAARVVRRTGASEPVTAVAGFVTATTIAAVTTLRRTWLDNSRDEPIRRRLAALSNGMA